MSRANKKDEYVLYAHTGANVVWEEKDKKGKKGETPYPERRTK